MPKRSNPWSDGPQQMKTHVGQMELAQGVAGPSILAKIHENTKNLLAEGARKFYSGNVENAEPMQEMTGENNNNIACAAGHKDIAAYFGGKSIMSMKTSNKELNKGPRCNVCVSPDIAARCSFCECQCCLYCLRTCTGCDKDFCALCAIVSYDGPTERAYCLNCT